MGRGKDLLSRTRARLRSPLSVIVAVATITAGFTGTVVYAAVAITSPDDSGTIHACYDHKGKGAGKIRIVNAGTTCKPSERPLSWKSLTSISDLNGTSCKVGAVDGVVSLNFDSQGRGSFYCDIGQGEPPGPDVCGDGVRGSSESCDDGNDQSGDGCTAATCEVETGYGCSGSPSVCSPVCGDHVTTTPEVCDDGNTINETSCPYGTQSCTSCNSTCSGTLVLLGPICGDGVTDVQEACDDGNTNNGDACSSDCSTVTAP